MPQNDVHITEPEEALFAPQAEPVSRFKKLSRSPVR